MIVKQTTNREDIRRVLCDPDIYDTIDEDGSPSIEDVEFPIDDENIYIGGYVNSNIIAVMCYDKYLDGQECHVQVLPEFRKKYAKSFGEQSLEYRGTQPLYAEIPDLYPNVLKFALDNNFKVVGIRKNDFIKHGKTYDIKVLRFQNGKVEKNR